MQCQRCHNDTEQRFIDEQTGTEYIFCEVCRNELTFKCGECLRIILKKWAYKAYGVLLCPDCYNESYFRCVWCANTYDLDDAWSCEQCGNNYCADCYHGATHVCLTPIYELPVRPKAFPGNNPGKHIVINRLMGAELELIGPDNGWEKRMPIGSVAKLIPKLPQKVRGIRDGSLGVKDHNGYEVENYGIEIVIPPSSMDEYERFITESCAVARRYKFRATKKCGFHVHVDATDFHDNLNQVKSLLMTCYSIEDLLLSMNPKDRWANFYCQRINKYSQDILNTPDKDSLEEYWYGTDDKREIHNRKSDKHDETHYYGVNIHSLFHRGTIEFRYHSGTVNVNKILQWSNLVLRIVDYAINRYEPKDVKQLFSMGTSEEKLEKMFIVMGIPFGLQDYIRERINKFNPGFSVKFTSSEAAAKRAMNKYTGMVNRFLDDDMIKVAANKIITVPTPDMEESEL